MAEEEKFRLELEFDAKSADPAKAMVDSLARALSEAGVGSERAEKAVNRYRASLNKLTSDASKAKSAMAAYQRAVGGGYSKEAQGAGKKLGLNYEGLNPNSIGAYRQLQNQINSANKAQQKLQAGAGPLSSTLQATGNKGAAAQGRLRTATTRTNAALRAQRGAANQLGNYYPLIVAAGIMGTIATAALKLGTAVVKTGVEYNSAFAQVARTTTATTATINTKIANIREGLRDLAAQIPVTFQDLAGIATLGNQLGIASDDVVEFTKIVSEFSAITGVSTEETAKSFGSLAEILNVSSDQYENLGSAITFVGRNSVATEAEILTMSQKIGATAEQAGFTAEQVIGLSGALSSLREAPERSQGALEIYFKTINKAASQGGESLDKFAGFVGLSTSATEKLIQTAPYEFFRRFEQALSQLSPEQKTAALDSFGLSGTRVSEVLRRLSANLNVVDKTQADAAKSFGKGTDLGLQYSVVAETLAAKFQILKNNVGNLLDTLANSGALAGLAGVVGALSDLVSGLDSFAQKNGQVVQAILGLGVAVGILAALRTAYFLAAIAASALAGANARVAGTNLGGTLLNIIGTLTGVRVAGFGAAGGMGAAATGATVLRGALAALFRATIILGVLAAITELALNFGGSMQFIAGTLYSLNETMTQATSGFFNFAAGVTGTMQAAVNAVSAAAGAIGGIIGNLVSFVSGAIGGILGKVNGLQKTGAMFPEFVTRGGAAENPFGDFKKWADALPTGSDIPDYSKLGQDSLDLAKGMENINSTAPGAAKGIGDVGKAAGGGGGGGGGGAAKEIRTLIDYANDLTGVFDRMADLTFGKGLAKDDISTQFNTMVKSAQDAAKAVEDAKNRIREIRAEIGKLKADNVQQGYFLSVANAFGDTKRASTVQSNIDTNNADIATKKTDLSGAKGDLSTAQAANSKSLKGTTQGAIDQRKALSDLFNKYSDYIGKLAESGLKQDDLKKKVAEAKEEFVKQGEKLGYSRTQLEKYTGAFDGLKTIVDKVPRNVTIDVKANASAASQALREFVAKTKKAGEDIAKNLSGGGGGGFTLPKITNPNNDKDLRRMVLEAELAALVANYKRTLGAGGNSNAAIAALNRAKGISAQLRSGDYYTGGYTGRGGMYEPAGIVHRGEYVVPKAMVDQNTGLPRADALGRLIRGTQGRQHYAAGGFVNPGMSVVELGPKSMQVLRNAVHSEVAAYIEPKAIAGAANSVNSNRRRRGGD